MMSSQLREPYNFPGKRITVQTEGQPDRFVEVVESHVTPSGSEMTTWRYEDTGEVETREVWFTIGADEV